MRKAALLVIAFVLLIIPVATVSAAPSRPNIIVILLDDMGWSDLGCYGGEVHSPNIDRLAAEGMRFTQFYNTGRCCPTRASLLTGLYPHQAGVGAMTFDRGVPGYRGQLNHHCATIAEVLSPAGYRAFMVGKWHLSLTKMYDHHMAHLNNQIIRETFADPATYPVGRGFEEHYGVIWGVVDYFDPFSLVHNTIPIQRVGEDYYITDALTDHAVQYIDKYSQGDAPFFLYLAYTAPHWPLHARPEDIAKYKDTYRAGWQAIREARYRRQIDMGLIDPANTPLSDRNPPTPDWPDDPDQKWDAAAMSVHAAMIDRVDQGIGRIIEKLKAIGRYDNTLILLLSDNGASPEIPGRPGFDRASQTRDGRTIHYLGGNGPKDILPGPQTTYASIGPHWANAANTPFRYWKATQHEGGIRTPLIAHWPNGIAAEPGSTTSQVGHVIDIMATCVDLAQADYPNQVNGNAITPMQGISLLPILQGKTRAGHDVLYFEHSGAQAVREGDWKLVSLPDKKWELYNMARDQSETHDLAAEQPDRVEHMQELWRNWANSAQVLPRHREQ